MKRRTFFLAAGVGVGTLLGGTFSRVFSFFSSGKSVKNFREVPKNTIEKPAGEYFSSFIIGDWGAGGSFQKRVADAMSLNAQKRKPNIIISTGDNIYPDGVESADDKQWVTKFENMYNSPSLSVPWYAVLGNHDYRSNPDAQIEYSKKNKQWNMPARYYKFSPHSTIEYFMLDTQTIMMGKAEKQLQWFEEEVKRSKAQWKIVVGHHPMRSYGHYGDLQPLLKSLKPLFDKYGVQFYLCGHDHDLQFIKNPNDNFHCIISGAGGGARDTAYGEHSLFAATNGGFVIMETDTNYAYVSFINAAGENIYFQKVV